MHGRLWWSVAPSGCPVWPRPRIAAFCATDSEHTVRFPFLADFHGLNDLLTRRISDRLHRAALSEAYTERM